MDKAERNRIGSICVDARGSVDANDLLHIAGLDIAQLKAIGLDAAVELVIRTAKAKLREALHDMNTELRELKHNVETEH